MTTFKRLCGEVKFMLTFQKKKFISLIVLDRNSDFSFELRGVEFCAGSNALAGAGVHALRVCPTSTSSM